MPFTGVNYLAVVAAAAAAFFFGFAYYMTLGKQWMAATGRSEEELKAGGMAKPMIVSIVSHLIMSFMLAGLLSHFGPDQLNVKSGAITGVALWFGFVATSVAVNYAWQRAKPMLSVIDNGHWLGVLLIQGAILGLIGV